MNVEKHTTFYSPILGQRMPVSVYGHFGVPLLFFPTASSDFEELERHGMIDALRHHVEAGRIKIFSLNSINQQSWFNHDIPPYARLQRQAQYDRHVAEELVPFIHWHCRGEHPIATAGSSMGAFHAANTLLRHPRRFRWGFFMSGIYDLAEYFEGHWDQNCFEQNPGSYLQHLDAGRREALQKCSINVICGQGPWERVHWSQRLHDLLDGAGIPHNYDLWGHDVAHDWPWWFKQMDLYVRRLF